ncbi:MAG: deoxyribose-phosphate aldolase [Coprobacillus sp.]|nr:deoxyribose-phosphate aldolase [Coprobacillus sp.]
MTYNKLIDHTLLKQDATPSDIKSLCEEALTYDFMSVCVNPCYVSTASNLLKGSDVKVCTVIGFPLGMSTTASKISETEIALYDGADEIDMVINVGMLKAENTDYVLNEIKELKDICKEHILKVILETCLLTDEEIVTACSLAKDAKADFVKTSTGFSTGGATVHAVELMRKTVGPDMGVKASGGIRTHEDLLAMVNAGANRIGTSAGPKII